MEPGPMVRGTDSRSSARPPLTTNNGGLLRIVVRNAALAVRACQLMDGLAYPFTVTVKEGEPRNAEQNSRMWAMLGEIAEQIDWYGHKLIAEEWKDVFTAILKGQKAVPGDGGRGFIIIGQRTSKMTKQEMSDLIALMEAFGAERGVKFSAQ